MSWSTILPLLAIVSFLVTAATVVGQSFRVSKHTQTVAAYRDSALAFEAKAAAQAVQITDLEHANAAKEAEITELRGRVSVLQEIVTGKADIARVETKVDEVSQHLDLLGGQVMEAIGKMREDVGAVEARLVGRPPPPRRRT